MPNIKPISDLKNYAEAHILLSKLKKAEERADKEGWISAEELEHELELIKLKED